MMNMTPEEYAAQPTAWSWCIITRGQCRISPTLGPLMMIYKKKVMLCTTKRLFRLCYATSRGLMDFKTKYPNAKIIWAEPRP